MHKAESRWGRDTASLLPVGDTVYNRPFCPHTERVCRAARTLQRFPDPADEVPLLRQLPEAAAARHRDPLQQPLGAHELGADGVQLLHLVRFKLFCLQSKRCKQTFGLEMGNTTCCPARKVLCKATPQAEGTTSLF